MAGSDNFNFSNMQLDQSQQVAPNTPSLGFEAATAALDTNELLHLIIAEVPREFRNSLRRVSKSWQAAVVKLGYVLEPTYPAKETSQWTLMPRYALEQTLVCNKSNPAIACYARNADFDCPDEDPCNCDSIEGYCAEICFDPHKISEQEGVERELEFIINPPITEVKVAVGYCHDRWSRYDNEEAVLRVPGGIRIRDLKECFGKMRYFDYAYGSVASFGVLWQDSDPSSDCLPFFPPNLVPDPLDDYRRPRFGSEIGKSQDETGGGNMSYASEADDVSQGEEGGFSPKQYDQSPPGAEVQVYEAATAALDTNELLHLIIDEVPREYRTQLRRVSRAWKAAVEKLGHVIDPLEINPIEIDPLEDDEYDGFYTSPARCVYRLPRKRLVCNESNPLIRCRKKDTDFYWMEYSCLCEGYWGMRVDITFDREGISGMSQSLKWEDEFITDPPITQVHFVQDFMYDPVTLCVRGGIRVRDLKEFFRNMEDNWSGRVVSFQVLHQHSKNPAEVCWWHVDNYKGLRFDREVAESQEQTGGGDTPYASEADDSQGDDGEFCEGGLESDQAKSGYQTHQWRLQDELEQWSNSSQGDACETGYAETRYASYAAGDEGEGVLASKEQEDGYEWNFETELEGSLSGGQGDRNATGGGETPPATNADYYGQGDHGEGSPASQEPDDGHEWSWEAEVEKRSKASQGDASETGGGETPYENSVDHPGQRGNGEAGFTREELEDGHEWDFEAELEKWSKLD
jgi:hypothetical protein